MKFRLVVETHEKDFENKVNILIKQGWVLKGNHNAVHKSGLLGLVYTQAMVKED